MNAFTRCLAACLILAGAAPVCAPARAAEPPADLAKLFPVGTLAYAELVNPGELAPELASVFKGTALEDSISFIHGKKDAAKTLLDLNGKETLSVLGLLASPEMMGELKKLHIAVALTGFSANGDPDFALVVLTHDSPASGLAARAYITMSPTLRRVGEVSKVPVFQRRSPNINYDNNGVPTIQNDKPLADGPHEPTFAYTPGLFVLGSSKAAVGGVVKRFLGEEKTESLANLALFTDAAAAHRKTGLFYFVNFPEFSAKFDAANKLRGRERGVEELVKPLEGAHAAGDLDLFAWFKLTANPKAVKSVAGLVRFRDGGVSATLAAAFDPAHKSPLLDFLSGAGAKLELLHSARGPSTFAIGVTLPEKNRAASVVNFLDAMAKASGTLGRLPSEAVRELEQKLKVAITKDLIEKTRAVTVFLPTSQELPKGAKPLPILVLHAEDAATAGAWEGFIPQLVGDLAGGAAAQASSETIGGVKVLSLPGAGLPFNAPVHYARSGTALAIGLDRKHVAAAVKADAAGSVVGGDKLVSPPPADTPAFGVVSLGELLIGLGERPRPEGPVVPKEEEPLVLPNGNPLPENFMADLKKARKAFAEAVAKMPPATVSARRTGNELRVELFQPKVQAGGLKAVIDAGATWLDKAGAIKGANRSDGGIDRYDRLGKW